jgi:hypothetical protein
MGRSLFYGIDDSVSLTDEQKVALHELSKRYRSEYKWDCISAWFPSLYKFDTPEECDDEFDEEQFAEDLAEMFERNKYRDENDDDEDGLGFGIKGVTEDQLDRDEKDTILFGCTLAGGNEFDAHNVIKFVVDASKILPDYVLYLDDDGFALYCPVLIKNGLAKPDHKRINYQLDNMINNFMHQKKGLYDPAKRIKFFQKLQNHKRWTNINKFVRPLDVFEKPEKTPEKNIDDFNDIDDDTIQQLRYNLAIEEFLEQCKYYNDIDSYPEEIL